LELFQYPKFLEAFFLNEAFSQRTHQVTKDEIYSLWSETSHHPIAECLGVSEESLKLLTFDHTEQLHKVLEAFAQGHHRVLVKTGDRFKVLSQFDVVSYLDKKSGTLGGVTKYQASIISRTDKKLITISEELCALTAFRELAINRLSAAPVVNSESRVVGTLTFDDLLGLRGKDLEDTLLTTSEFLKKIHGPTFPLVTICPDEKLLEILSLVTRAHVHRAWIIDEDSKPIGVVSLTDIIATLLLDKLSSD